MTQDTPDEDELAYLRGYVKQPLADAATKSKAERRVSRRDRADDDDASMLVRGDTIKLRPIDWLWRGQLARGKFHIVAGDPATNKTTIVLAVIATVTSGGKWPDGTGAAIGDAVIWSGEDAYDDTLCPRLIANCADMTRVHFVRRRDGKSKRPFDPARDMPDLALEVSRVVRPAIFMLDPVVSAVRGDSNGNAEVRRGLQPFVDLCEQTGAAGIGVSHFSKNTTGRTPLERVTGSLAFGATPRVVLACAKVSPDHGGGRMLVRAKSNIGPDGNGFTFHIEPVNVQGCETIRALWGKRLDGEAAQLLKSMALVTEENAADDDETARFLRDLLTEAGGCMSRKDVVDAGKQAGFSESALDRARQRAGVRHRISGFGVAKRAEWFLPNSPTSRTPERMGGLGDMDPHTPQSPQYIDPSQDGKS